MTYTLIPIVNPLTWGLQYAIMRDGVDINCTVSAELPADLFVAGICGKGNWNEVGKIIEQEYLVSNPHVISNEDFDAMAQILVNATIPVHYR